MQRACSSLSAKSTKHTQYMPRSLPLPFEFTSANDWVNRYLITQRLQIKNLIASLPLILA